MFKLQDFTDRINYLQMLIKNTTRSLKKAPQGSLRVNAKGEIFYYDYFFQGKRRRLKTRSKRDQALARALAQRDYDKKVLKGAQEELKIIEKLEKFYAKGCAEDIYEQMSKARQALVTPIRLTDEQYAEKWQAQELRKVVIPPEVMTFDTEGGEEVRSKSEVFIANTLRRRGRRYHYECAVEVIDHLTGRKRTVYPDFYVLNPRTRKTYYWEHFGRCDDPDYVNRNLNKLIDYRSAGIVPGVNLIMTFETKQNPIPPKVIEDVIDSYLS